MQENINILITTVITLNLKIIEVTDIGHTLWVSRKLY
jgi:hypothetical protein